MHTKTSHFLIRAMSSLIIGACLILVSTADATAHDVEYRTYVVHRQTIRSPAPLFPHWLHQDRDFQHWYLGSRYRMTRDASWHRLYDIYRFDQRLRLQSRRFHGRLVHSHGYSHGYRTYRARPKKHRH